MTDALLPLVDSFSLGVALMFAVITVREAQLQHEAKVCAESLLCEWQSLLKREVTFAYYMFTLQVSPSIYRSAISEQ